MEEIKGKVGPICSWLNVSTMHKMNFSILVALYTKTEDRFMFFIFYFIYLYIFDWGLKIPRFLCKQSGDPLFTFCYKNILNLKL